eukprot:1182301-Prorocentrum_minimum.AAC.2
MSYVMCYAMQLNPGGCLNWKYYGETFVRSSGMPYCVVRACGLVTEDLDKYFNMVCTGVASGPNTDKSWVPDLASKCAEPRFCERASGNLVVAALGRTRVIWGENGVVVEALGRKCRREIRPTGSRSKASHPYAEAFALLAARVTEGEPRGRGVREDLPRGGRGGAGGGGGGTVRCGEDLRAAPRGRLHQGELEAGADHM